MPKNLAWFFLLVYLFGATQLHELAKVPLLVVHYMDHEQNDPSMGIGYFFEMHYAANYAYDDDCEKDRQLPFKNTTCFLQSTFYDHIQSIPLIVYLLQPCLLLGHSLTYYVNSSPKSDYLAGIWQPPKNLTINL